MGNCCGGAASNDNNINRNKARREQAWMTTGTVSLRDSKLKELPSRVWAVGSAAKTLDATNNRLTDLPPLISTLSNLQRLILATNQLSALPVQISALTSLKVLVLDSNRLVNLPEEIVLKLSKNKFSAIPDELGACSALEEIDFADNYLQVLPESLGSLTRLKVLAADQNRIAAVPPAIFKGCTSLHTLTLHENPITIEAMEATEGYEQLERRRRSKFDKQIANRVLLGSAGLDEGIDRNVKLA
ncbi:hypothetical protein WJX75_005826 [Coccomyxa subellipsoidea]|uniref:L domain-like protein n=1 Tax=Coccomyxa subellipsoidea TaxID=248742 RepID=A0ABR2YQD0_9CHLO